MNAVDFDRNDTVTFTTVVRNHSETACEIGFSPPCYDAVGVVTAHSHSVWSSGSCELPPPPKPRAFPAHGRLTYVEQWNQRPSCGPFPCGSPAPPKVAPGRYFAHATCLVSYDDNDFIFITSQQIGFTIRS